MNYQRIRILFDLWICPVIKHSSSHCILHSIYLAFNLHCFQNLLFFYYFLSKVSFSIILFILTYYLPYNGINNVWLTSFISLPYSTISCLYNFQITKYNSNTIYMFHVKLLLYIVHRFDINPNFSIWNKSELNVSRETTQIYILYIDDKNILNEVPTKSTSCLKLIEVFCPLRKRHRFSGAATGLYNSICTPLIYGFSFMRWDCEKKVYDLLRLLDYGSETWRYEWLPRVPPA